MQVWMPPSITDVVDFVDYRGLKLWLVKSSFVVLIGGITGAYMAFDKFRRWQEPPIEIRVTPEDIQ